MKSGFLPPLRLCTLLMTSLTVVVSTCVVWAAGVPDRRVDSIFAEWDKPASPGCVVGIIKDGSLIFARGYGMANIEHQIPITPATLFNIGSTSKQFTSACILLLAGQGKLSLEDDVRKYIPELPDYGTPITIRRLLNHTSGLRDYITLLYLSGVHVEDLVPQRDALEMIVRQKALNFNPGDEWLYSNTGYYLASVIVERVSGVPLTEFAEKNIFKPLGMAHTTWVGDAKRILPGVAEGYAAGRNGDFQTFGSGWNLVGDGGIYTTVGDLAIWDKNFYEPVVGGVAMIDQLTTPGTLAGGKPLEYGLGLFIRKYKGRRIVRHEGEWAGYKADFIRFPDERLSVICLCNLSTMIPTQLVERVADVLLPGAPEVPKAATRAPSTDRPVPAAGDLARDTGYYRNPLDESVRHIAMNDGKLWYGRVPGTASGLSPDSDEGFTMLGVPADVRVRFEGAGASHAAKMDVAVDGGAPIVFQSFEPVVLTKARCREYAGDYFSEELNARYIVDVRDTQLVVRIPRFDDLPLDPTVKDIFKYLDFRNFVFRRDSADQIVGFAMTTGRTRNIYFAKGKT